MRPARERDRLASSVTLAVVLPVVMTLGTARVAQALTPAVNRVLATTNYDAAEIKVARAECGWMKLVLGGEASVSGGAGKVAIQGAFPMFDAGLNKWVYVVKARAIAGTLDSWSVTAVAYCYSPAGGPPQYFHESSLFDSDPIKHATVACPAPLKVVGMGGEVVRLDETDPSPDTATIPETHLVFRGMEVDPDLGTVTAKAMEYGGVLGGTYAGNWKVTAVVACHQEAYFDGLELRQNRASAWGQLEPDSTVFVACSTGKKNIAVGASMIDDRDDGQWFVHRFVRQSGVQTQVFGKVYLNSGTAHVKHGVSTICVDK